MANFLFKIVSDDNYLDDVLADCIHGQDLYDNDCYKEIQSQLLLKTAAQKEEFVYVTIDEVVNALLCDSSKLTDEEKKIFLQYQVKFFLL